MSNLILALKIIAYLALSGFIWKIQSVLLASIKVNNPNLISFILILLEFLAIEEKIAKVGGSKTALKDILNEIAQAYRQYCSDIYPFMLDTGYVRIFQGEIRGWCADKGVASTERPTTILVGIDGKIFEAVGGSEQIGAKNGNFGMTKPEIHIVLFSDK